MNTNIQPRRPGLIALVHRAAGFIALPFLLVSIALALGLSHASWLHAVSEAVYPSLPIPPVAFDEPVRPGSWDQASRLAQVAVGAPGRVITTRRTGVVAIGGFVSHQHDPAVAARNRHTQVLVDTHAMRIVRIEDKDRSLFTQAHGVHAFRFFGIEWLAVSTISVVALLVLLATGIVMAWRDRAMTRERTRMARGHVRTGGLLAAFIIAVSVTTLDFEFSFVPNDRQASYPIPDVELAEAVRPGSIDQARALAARVIGAEPRAVFIGGDGDLKFSEAGDGIGGKSVWVDDRAMKIVRITDWRNDTQALGFIIHDGRWLGGLNAFNINDAAAFGLLFLAWSGLAVLRARRQAQRALPAHAPDPQGSQAEGERGQRRQE